MLLFLIFVSYIKTFVSQHDCLDDSPNYQGKYIQPILERLKTKKYTIHDGYLYWITTEPKHGGSPASSYGMWNISVPNNNLKPSPNAPMAMLFHSSDAILFTGCTAPNATYIGFENYAYAKYRPNGTNDSIDVVFGSMGAALNQYIMNISNDYGSAPFDSIVTIITSGDKVTYRDIYEEYVTAGLEHTVNNNWIPQQYFNYIPYNFTKYDYTVFTYPGHIDSLMPVTRIINHLDENDWKKYVTYKQPVYWITAEKLRSDDSVTPREPFTELYTRNHTSSRDEFQYQKPFNMFMNDTIAYFEGEYKMKLVEVHKFINYNIGEHYYGYVCYDNNWNCQGDLRDEQYWGTHNGTNVARQQVRPQGAYNLLNDSYFVVIGINHFNTNFTVYDNIIMYYMENRYLGLYEPIGLLNHVDYNNSVNAAGITTSVSSDILQKFYIVQVARPQHCEGKNIPGICPNESMVETQKKFGFYTRNLLNMETLTRPAQNQIIPDVLLRFKIPN